MNKITMKAARVNAGMTQKDMSAKMHVTVATISTWERGIRIPKPAQFEMYCRICGRPTDDIFLPKRLG